MLSFNPFPNIETKNLVLRRISHTDASDMFEMRSDPRMIDFTDSKLDENLDETNAYIAKMNKGIDENNWIIWAIEHKEAHKVIGSISIWNINSEQTKGELGYGVIPAYQGKGLMKEALLGVIEYAFKKMNLRTLEAYTEENHQSSIKLLEKCNFTKTDIVDDSGIHSNRVYRMAVYSICNPIPAKD